MVEKYKVRIRGTRPLLMHRYPTEDYLNNNQGPERSATPKDPRIEAEKALYKNKQGKICTPAIHIKGCLIKAGTDYKIPGKGRKTFKDAIKSGIIIEPDLIPHINQKWELDIRPVVIQRSRIPRARPRFDEWELEFFITVLDERIREPILKEILTTAGRFYGIGDYRPNYGLFEVVEFSKIE